MSELGREQALRAVISALGEVAPEIDIARIDHGLALRDQVDLDSYDFLQVIIRIHEMLGIDIPESDYAELASIDGTVAYLVARAARRD